MGEDNSAIHSQLAQVQQELWIAKARLAELEPQSPDKILPSFHTVLDNLIEGCQIISFDWRYLYVNDTAARYGRQAKEELLGSTLMERYPGIENTEMFAFLKRCMEERVAQDDEFEFTYPDGNKAYIEFRVRPASEGIFIQTLDVTEQHRAEQYIRKSNRTRALLSRVNEAIVRIRDINALFDSICHIAVEEGGFCMAWVGQIDPKSNHTKVASYAHRPSDSVDRLLTNLGNVFESQQQITDHLRIGEHFICNQIKRNPIEDNEGKQDSDIELWRSEALRLGYRAFAILPLMLASEVRGTLHLYSDEPDFFDENQVKLLDEIAANLSLVMNFADQEEKRRQTQDALRASEERYRILVESSEAVIAVFSRQGRLLYANKIAASALNLTPETITDKMIDELFPLPIAKSYLDTIQRVIETGQNFVNETLTPVFGQQRWYRNSIQAVKNGSGHETLALVHAVDITRDKDAEEALRQSEARYRSIVEDQTELVCRYDRNCRLTYVNRAYAELYKKRPEELIGTNFLELIPEDKREAAQAYIWSIGTQEPIITYEHTSMVPDGSQRWYQWTDRALENEKGEIVEYQGVGRDITERKQTEAAIERHTQTLEEMRQFLQTSLDAFPANAAVLDPSGKIIAVNAPWIKFADDNGATTPTHFVGENYLSICDNASGAMSEKAGLAAAGIRAVIAGRQDEFYLEYPCHSPNQDRWYMLRVLPFAEPAPRRVLMAHIDITEQEKAEQAEREQRLIAETLRDSLAVLTSSLDFETVMQLILAYSANIIHSDAGAIILFEGNTGRVAYTRGFSAEAEAYYQHNLISLDSGTFSKEFLDIKSYLAADTKFTPNWIVYPYAEWIQSSIGVPIVLGGKSVGLLTADSKTPNHFQHKDVENLLAFAGYAALALENAQNFDQLEQRVNERTAELQAAKERVEAILNNSADGILLVDSDFTIQQTNVAFHRLFACHPDECHNQPLVALLAKQDDDFIRKTFQAGVAENQATTVEIRARRRDGTEFDAELSIGSFKDGGWVCNIRDITERKSRERQLRLYASLQENVSDGVITSDLAFKIQSWNKAAEQIYGWPAEQVIGKTIEEVLHISFESDGERQRLNQELFTQGHWKSEVTQLHQDGSKLQLLTSVTLLKDEKNVPFGFVSVVHDITERKRAEEAINASLNEEREFQNYLKALHEITIELTRIDELETFYKRTVELGLERLGFERLALFLYDPNDNSAQGTYGTDAQGILVNEHHIRFVPDLEHSLLRAFSATDRLYINENVPLYSDLEAVGVGWNAGSALSNGTQNLGWLVADNLLSHTPASKSLLNILGLYALTVGTLLARKQAQIELQKNEALYRLLAENITDVVMRSNAAGEFLYVSPSSQSVMGYEPHELTGQHYLTFIHPDDLTTAAKLRVDAVNSVYSRGSLVVRFRHKQGHYIWLETIGQVVRSEKTGKAEGFISSSRDISERKRAEEALAESEERFRQIAENIDQILFVRSGDDEKMLYVNPRYEDMWELSRESLYENPLSFAERVSPDDLDYLQQQFLTTQYIDEGLADFEFRIIPPQQGLRWVRIRTFPIKGDDGAIVRRAGVIEDITERKSTEAALQENEEKYRHLVETMQGGLAIYDIDGKVTYVNDRAGEILGYSRQEIVGSHIYDFLNRATMDEEKLRFFQMNQEGAPCELVAKHKSGRDVHLLVSGSPLVDKSGNYNGSFVVMTDISTQKQAEETLRQALAKEKELGELKTRFVSMASHEFRTPLATILATTETLSAYRHKMTDQQIEKRLHNIFEQIGHLKNIMEDMLQLARIQARRVEFNPVLLNIDALYRSVIDEFHEGSAMSPRLSYQCEDSSREIMLDKKLMRQILSNLISNALKYSNEDAEVRLSIAYEQDQLILTVSDNGVGIPEADKKHLFEPFHRGVNVGTVPGTGLGLTIVKEAVELHNGEISFTSEEDLGTSVTVRIPVRF